MLAKDFIDQYSPNHVTSSFSLFFILYLSLNFHCVFILQISLPSNENYRDLSCRAFGLRSITTISYISHSERQLRTDFQIYLPPIHSAPSQMQLVFSHTPPIANGPWQTPCLPTSIASCQAEHNILLSHQITSKFFSFYPHSEFSFEDVRRPMHITISSYVTYVYLRLCKLDSHRKDSRPSKL
jgi:hypothetical protein